MKKILPFIPLLALLLVLLSYSPIFLSHKLPSPADTIYGLYYPWRDSIATAYPNGLPFKNFLVTDPVRQQFVWRNLAMSVFASGKLPLWNPYSFSGTPLWGNIQSAPFYPLNILYVLGPQTAWTLQIVMQTLLGFAFMYVFLKHKKLSSLSATIGSLAWAGSGFFVSWLTLNTLVQVAIYLPLIFLTIDITLQTARLKYSLLLAFGLACSFLAGALQIFLYVVVASGFYFLWQVSLINKKALFHLLISIFVFALLTAPQWIAFLHFLPQSARTIDANDFVKPGWFLPWQNLAQFFAPDYFGNPATLNYFGVWNYMEFLPYIGLWPLTLALIAITNKLTREKLFYVILLVLCLVFALPNALSNIPYRFSFPLLSTVQPTRLIVLIDFSLAILSAYGSEIFLEDLATKKSKLLILGMLTAVFSILWLIALKLHLSISLKNLYLPTALLFVAMVALIFSSKKNAHIFLVALLLLTIFDLSRVFLKFEPFSEEKWLFGQTKITDYLIAHTDLRTSSRIASLDDRIFPPNFSVSYHLPMISGYDSLAVRRYLQLVAAIDRNSPDISEPWGYNRIVTPKNYQSKLFALLGVQYLLTFDSLKDANYQLVMTEGQTKLYKNLHPLPKAYLATNVLTSSAPQQSAQQLYSQSFVPGQTAVIEGTTFSPTNTDGWVKVENITTNDVVLAVQSNHQALVVLNEIYYSSWQATVDGKTSEIYPVNLAFRGVIVPAGKHTVHMFVTL